jgi:hypothetical protein
VAGGFGEPAIDPGVQLLELCAIGRQGCGRGWRRSLGVDPNTVMDVFREAENRM